MAGHVFDVDHVALRVTPAGGGDVCWRLAPSPEFGKEKALATGVCAASDLAAELRAVADHLDGVSQAVPS
ncbi:hypothetical protein [Pacificoceanicola onchidii]|uniref:hypothetical protein n=1 Tax=Pacificoceanicola onchidii TaxID=2562685 RepID=UPI0010A49140|nr:hypothetical protein [Pacificoceanicola onchidii]